MKTLILVRHAKSSWKEANLADHDRPLNDRGRRDIPTMGDRLAKRGIAPDMIVSSTAERAAHTATLLAPYIGLPASRVIASEDLYLAEPDVYLSITQLADANVDSLMLVGHNPGITQFANMLTDVPIDHMPTCAAFICQFQIKAWHELTLGTGEYVAFEYPKKY